MSYIDELRERFEAAEQRFGRINEAGREYRDRLMGLMSRIEEEVRCRRDVEQQQAREIERLSGEIDRISGENEQLRTMMMSLLTAVENGDDDGLGSTLNDMDTKVSVLIGEGQGAAMPPSGSVAEPAADPVEETAEFTDEFSDESDEGESFSAPSFSAGDMMSSSSDEPPFSGEDADLDRGDDEAVAEEAAVEEEDMPVAEAHVETETETETEIEASDSAVSSDADEPAENGTDAEVASDMAEFFGADDQGDGGDAVPDYSHAVAGWEDFLDEDDASDAGGKETLSEVSADFVAEDAGDPEAGSIHDLIDRVKTVVDGDDDADPAVSQDAGDDATGEDEDDSGKAAAQ